jgi:hypothetical protein
LQSKPPEFEIHAYFFSCFIYSSLKPLSSAASPSGILREGHRQEHNKCHSLSRIFFIQRFPAHPCTEHIKKFHTQMKCKIRRKGRTGEATQHSPSLANT